MNEQDKQNLELFKSEFTKWQKRFGLEGYKTYFKYEPLGDSYASVSVKHPDMVATVRFNSHHTTDARKFLDAPQTAKHEAIHLLLARLENRACERFATDIEIYEAIEEVTHKLEGLIR